jgi:hypothetical protein
MPNVRCRTGKDSSRMLNNITRISALLTVLLFMSCPSPARADLNTAFKSQYVEVKPGHFIVFGPEGKKLMDWEKVSTIPPAPLAEKEKISTKLATQPVFGVATINGNRYACVKRGNTFTIYNKFSPENQNGNWKSDSVFSTSQLASKLTHN